jgi:hypothetical protein
MEDHRAPSPHAAATDAAAPRNLPDPAAPPPPPQQQRIGWIDGHLPDQVDPLVPLHPDTAFTQTRRLRHDGWSPEKMRLFLERFAECGIVAEACEAAGMSARSAYNLRDRDSLFAAGWDAATVKARPRLADEAFSRSMNGVVERIYKDGLIVAERHRYDNRLTMAVLTRLDARADRAEAQGAAHLQVAARWDDYLDALGEDRREDGLALLAPPASAPESDLQEKAGHRELHELHPGGEAGMDDSLGHDPHTLYEIDGRWWTDYPPPADFDGEEKGEYGDGDYMRTLSPAEQAVIDADEDQHRADSLARAEAQRDAYFFGDPDEPPADAPGDEPDSSAESRET